MSTYLAPVALIVAGAVLLAVAIVRYTAAGRDTAPAADDTPTEVLLPTEILPPDEVWVEALPAVDPLTDELWTFVRDDEHMERPAIFDEIAWASALDFRPELARELVPA